jgi:uncharacterized repeat protein (TIGR01451 family)
MKGKFWLALVAALVILVLTASLASATAYHTIVVDGDLSDWDADEFMETDGGYDLYVTWDADNIYLGLTGAYLGDDPVQDRSFFVCFDTDLTPLSGAAADGYGSVNFDTNLFAPEACYYFAGGAGWYEWSTWNGTSWDWMGWRDDGTFYHWPANPAPLPGSEFTIIRAEIGNPSAVGMVAWVTPEQPVPGSLEASWPTPNPTGALPTFTHHYHFPSLVDGVSPDDSVLADHVIINELDNYTEWVELYNPTDSAVDIGNWQLTADIDSLNYTIPPGTILGAGSYWVYNTTGDLDNGGDVISLYDGGAALVDQVGYGNYGGAPAPSTVYRTAARVPNGTDTGDHARDWNLTLTPTSGSANDAPTVLLGSNLILNEFDNYPVAGNDMVEVYNPTAGTIVLTDWLLSDGDAVAPIVTAVSVPPGGWLVLEETVDWTVSMDFSSYDVGYLFQPDGIRVDQIGWAGEYEDNTFQRIPDGAGPNDGYDWGSSGGGVSWFDLPETLGYSNAYLRFEKEAPTLVGPGDLFTYTLTVENLLGTSLTNVVITDVVPVSTTFAYALDGGTFDNGVVSWNVPSLPSPGSLVVRFAVTATDNYPTIVVNDDYAIAAANYTPPRFGAPAMTLVDTDTSLSIHHLQWSSHRSPFAGQTVQGIHGIVTVLHYNGFYMQDPNPDGSNATSEGIFVYTGGAPAVDVGDEVLVDGVVSEYYPGGYGSGNLSTSQLGSPTVVISSTGNALPAPTIIGTGGRIPPQEVIDDDATGDVETSGSFDADTDGIDFYESLEGMLVQVNDALAVGVTNYGEIPVVGDNGDNAIHLTPRDGIVVRAEDFNPERILVDDTITDTIVADVGVSFTGPITGVIDYSFGNFKLFIAVPLPGTTGGVISETTTAPLDDQLRVASFNVYNLDPGDNPTRVAGLAGQIVNNLQSPDIIGLQEIQDNSGEDDDGIVDASETYTMLIDAILAAGGPIYDFRDIAPENNQDGGAPGANIRVGFLFRTDRGLSFIDRPGGDATTPVTVTLGTTGVELSFSPGRIDPNNPAFIDSRKPLAGEFVFNGHKLLVVVNHFNSKGGDAPLFGRVQPPVLASEVQRIQQAQVVNDFVDTILALDPDADVIVMGDLNDFQFSTPISDTLAADVLTNLVHTLPITEAYTYLYDGNSQVLDHILASDSLFGNAFVGFDIVHVNAEFAYSYLRPSDHDPVLATFLLQPFDLTASTKTVEPAGSISAGEVLTYTVTLSNTGGVDAMVTITDTLPDELILISGFDGGGLTWSGVVTAGEAVPLTLVAQADPMLEADVVVSNVVTIDDGVNPAFDIYSPETEILVPSLTIAKEVTPDQDVELGGIVTYTITLDNAGNGTALGVVMTDVLPIALDFGGWVQQSGAVQANDAITWTGDIDGGAQVVLVFTATVTTDEAWYGQPVTNDATYTSINAGGVTHSAVFHIVEGPEVFYVYLPVVAKEH